MEKFEKFLRKLSKKRYFYIVGEVLPKIRALELSGLDVRQMSGHQNLYRVRVGKIRILFAKDENLKRGLVLAIGFRENIYKNL